MDDPKSRPPRGAASYIFFSASGSRLIRLESHTCFVLEPRLPRILQKLGIGFLALQVRT